MFEETERDLLRKVAREAAARAMGLRPAPAAARPAGQPAAAFAPPASPLSLEEISGLFVTWLKEGRARGRSGTLTPDAPLHTLVDRHAVDALLHDPRVPPATAKELPRYVPQISVLSTLEEISSSSEVVVGTHGVVAEKGRRWGVVLPQDADGLDWSAERLLGQACLRAGLPEESWKTAGAVRLRRFTAETF
jgi:uncharacterized protein (TIGR00296 family)